METAFVLINTQIGQDANVYSQLTTGENIPENFLGIYEKYGKNVKNVDHVYGVYDMIIRIETDTLAELKDTVSEYIRGLKHVRSTVTMIVV